MCSPGHEKARLFSVRRCFRWHKDVEVLGEAAVAAAAAAPAMARAVARGAWGAARPPGRAVSASARSVVTVNHTRLAGRATKSRAPSAARK